MNKDGIITRKSHDCAYCGSEIPKGNKANYMEMKIPRLDNNDKQIGIEFHKFWFHADIEICKSKRPEDWENCDC